MIYVSNVYNYQTIEKKFRRYLESNQEIVIVYLTLDNYSTLMSKFRFSRFNAILGKIGQTMHFHLKGIGDVGKISSDEYCLIFYKSFQNITHIIDLISLDIGLIFVVFSVLMLGAFILSFAIPIVEGHQSGDKKINFLQLFRDHKLVLIYIYAFIIQATMGFFFPFHAVYSKELGISTQTVGLGIMIGSFSQFPFMLYFDKISKKIPLTSILIFSGGVSAVRWLLYAVALTPFTIYFMWILHGLTFIVFYLCLADYVNSNVVKGLKSSGQTMNYIILSGVSRIFGSALGGAISHNIGIGRTFLINSIICVFAVIGFIIITKTYKPFKDQRS